MTSKWCVTRTVEPAGRLAAQLWISEEGSPVAALSSLMVLTGRTDDGGGEGGEGVAAVAGAGGDEDAGAAWGRGGREGLAAVATTVPSSRRDRLKLGSYEVVPEICG